MISLILMSNICFKKYYTIGNPCHIGYIVIIGLQCVTFNIFYLDQCLRKTCQISYIKLASLQYVFPCGLCNDFSVKNLSQYLHQYELVARSSQMAFEIIVCKILITMAASIWQLWLLTSVISVMFYNVLLIVNALPHWLR
ncbi:unnamed protein product [Meganyctiphanes norvegica]|uniref:Uncharacterized protein n=1 Tax=Meganyctiphanes norvegica TaxID=48144 RepID=A0AAV2PST6_MEGNR